MNMTWFGCDKCGLVICLKDQLSTFPQIPVPGILHFGLVNLQIISEMKTKFLENLFQAPSTVWKVKGKPLGC